MTLLKPLADERMDDDMPIAVVMLSGGLDSTTMLYQTVMDGASVFPLTVDYGQRSRSQIAHAAMIAKAAKLDHRHLIVPAHGVAQLTYGLRFYGRQMARVRDREDHNDFPGLRAMMLTMGGIWARELRAHSVAIGLHGGDGMLQGFADAWMRAMAMSGDNRVTDVVTFGRMSKRDVVRRAVELGVPLEATWSCYGEVSSKRCGTCAGCVEVRRAFAALPISDPFSYANA